MTLAVGRCARWRRLSRDAGDARRGTKRNRTIPTLESSKLLARFAEKRLILIVVDIQQYAQQYSRETFDNLVRLSKTAKSETARIMAIKEILDRAHGRTVQPLQHSGEMALTHEQALDELERRFPRFIDGKPVKYLEQLRAPYVEED
jgi:hypothetical protein